MRREIKIQGKATISPEMIPPGPTTRLVFYARIYGRVANFHQPRAMGSPGFQGSISSKQEGLSNADTMNPYVNEPGKSAKGEGETETAKVKGTVSTSRPQV